MISLHDINRRSIARSAKFCNSISLQRNSFGEIFQTFSIGIVFSLIIYIINKWTQQYFLFQTSVCIKMNLKLNSVNSGMELNDVDLISIENEKVKWNPFEALNKLY